MATAAVQFPPSNTVLPGSRLLPTAHFPDIHSTSSSIPQLNRSPSAIAVDWLSALQNLLGGDHALISKLFLEESYWRDLLCMTWDFRTLQGSEQISRFIQGSPEDNRSTIISLDDSSAHKLPQASDFGGLRVIQAFLKVETSTGRGEGLVRLVSDLKELKGHEENICSRRPRGTESKLEDRGQNWKDLLTTQQNFVGDRQPIVLILGTL